MFNPNTLVFLEDSYLQQARAVPVNVLFVVLGVVLFSYLIRSFSLWRLSARLGIGSVFLSFLPFVRVILLYKLGVRVAGYKPVTRFISRVLLVIYAVSLFLVLYAPTPLGIVAGLGVVVFIYSAMLTVVVTLSWGITGRKQFLWYIPLVGPIATLITVYKSRTGTIYVRPRNYDGLFKKVEDREFVL